MYAIAHMMKLCTRRKCKVKVPASQEIAEQVVCAGSPAQRESAGHIRAAACSLSLWRLMSQNLKENIPEIQDVISIALVSFTIHEESATSSDYLGHKNTLSKPRILGFF